MIGIYKITNTVNNKCYIGQSKDLITRIQKHIKTLLNGTNRNEHLQNAYNTYGAGNFTIEIIEECTEENLDEREIYWIDFYHSYDREYGYNKTKGGTGGGSYYELLDDDKKEEVGQKIASSRQVHNKGAFCYTDGTTIKYIQQEDIEQYEANGWYRGVPKCVRIREKFANLGEKNGFYGKHHSEETKKRLSENKQGAKNWNYGMVLYHKDDVQKYIAQEDITHYESLGWTRGPTDEARRKISKGNKGKQRPKDALRKKSTIYTYNEQEYVGWRKLRAHLRDNGYPQISEAAIVKLSKGLHVRGYDNLFEKITIKEN